MKELIEEMIEKMGPPYHTFPNEMVWVDGNVDIRVQLGKKQNDIYGTNRDTGEIRHRITKEKYHEAETDGIEKETG